MARLTLVQKMEIAGLLARHVKTDASIPYYEAGYSDAVIASKVGGVSDRNVRSVRNALYPDFASRKAANASALDTLNAEIRQLKNQIDDISVLVSQLWAEAHGANHSNVCKPSGVQVNKPKVRFLAEPVSRWDEEAP